IFGKKRNKAIVVEYNTPKIFEFDPSIIPSNLTIYDSSDVNLAYIISSLMPPEFPLPLGIFLRFAKTSYENLFYNSVKDVATPSSVEEILKESTYEIK
ncbi:MAG: hypothetical protein KA059_07140, partial [Elusimicrobiales bacterium]|nr:hypothetical protein [Elusimicrobiales bacterium]